jgi:hypothetical protein
MNPWKKNLRAPWQQASLRCCLLAGIVFSIIFSTMVTVSAQPIFNSIPSPLPGNVSSLGPEAYAFSQLGDGLVFTSGSPRTLGRLKVVMSDWACQHGHWYVAIGTVAANGDGPCVTTPGASFSQAITLNIYAVVPGAPPQPGALLYTTTQTFQIPFRPSSDAPHCGPAGSPGGDGEQWYSAADNTCYHGFATIIGFELTGLTVPDQVIVGLQYNTSDFGPVPQRPKPCNAQPAPDNDNCPYDSLNISVEGHALTGSNLVSTGIYVNWTLPAFSCNGVGAFREDSGTCANSAAGPPDGWKELHPEIEVDPAADVYQVRYAANLKAGDSFVDITNSGASGGTICVNIYGFDAQEEMISCCSCPVTPNALVSLSARSLINTALTPATPNEVVIKLLATTPGTNSFGAAVCNTTPTNANLAPGMLAWGTTIHALSTSPTTYGTAETPFSPSLLSAAELTRLTTSCQFIQILGSGQFGICKGCQLGGLGAAQQ